VEPGYSSNVVSKGGLAEAPDLAAYKTVCQQLNSHSSSHVSPSSVQVHQADRLAGSFMQHMNDDGSSRFPGSVSGQAFSSERRATYTGGSSVSRVNNEQQKPVQLVQSSRSLEYGLNSDHRLFSSPCFVSQQHTGGDEPSVHLFGSNLTQDRDWQQLWRTYEQSSNALFSVPNAASSVDMQAPSSPQCSQHINLLQCFSFHSPQTLATQAHGVLQPAVSPSYVAASANNARARSPSSAVQSSYHTIHVPSGMSSHFPIPVAMPPAQIGPVNLPPASPRPVKRNLPPRLNLQPPGLCHTLNVPSPSSPRCTSPGFMRQSPFLNPSQPQSRTPSPISEYKLIYY
jgi:hypothetical protein